MRWARKVNLMVYCRLISVDDKIIKYLIGGLANDLTGELIVNKSDFSFELVKKPEKSVVFLSHIDSLLRKHRNEFLQGIFKKEIAREIG